MRIGRVISSEVAVNRDADSDRKTLLLTVELTDADDKQTVEYAQAAGEDFNPAVDTTVIVTDLGPAWKIAIAGDDGIEPESAPGEKEIYANVGGVKKGRLKCMLDGIVQAGAVGLNFVAQAGKVLSELQDVKSDLDAAKTAIESHIHVTTATVGLGPALGVISPTTTLVTTPHTPASVASTNLKSED